MFTPPRQTTTYADAVKVDVDTTVIVVTVVAYDVASVTVLNACQLS